MPVGFEAEVMAELMAELMGFEGNVQLTWFQAYAHEQQIDHMPVQQQDHIRMRYSWYACCQDRNSYRGALGTVCT